MREPVDEVARLDELRAYRILDTPSEPAFDRVVRLAARLCDTPMAVITLVDQDRQWFKATHGLALTETDRAVSFCARAIEHVGHFEVSDASTDPEFADNPFVMHEPWIRHYHGVPLVTPAGHALGTLAVIDVIPRTLDDLQRDAIDVLAEQVVVLLEERRRRLRETEWNAELEHLNEQLRTAAARYDELFRVNPTPMMVFDVETLRILDVNRAAVQFYGHSAERFTELTVADLRRPEDVADLRQYIADSRGRTFQHVGVVTHVLADGRPVLVDVSFSEVLRDGREARLARVQDVSGIEGAERRAEALHERLAHTLRTISDGVLVFDAEWRFTFANDAACELLGRRPDAILGSVLWDTFPESRGTLLEQSFRESVETGQPFEFEIRWIATGQWGEVRCFPGPDGLTVYFRDISARRAVAHSTDVLLGRLTKVLDVWRRLSDRDATVEEVLDEVPTLVMDVVGGEGAVLFLARGDRLVPRSVAGFTHTARTLPIHGSMAGLSFATGQVLVTGDIDHDERADLTVVPPEGTRSVMVAPIETDQERIGVVAVLDRAAHRFDEADTRSIELFSIALGAVVRSATASEAERASEERFRLVAQATSDAVYDLDLTTDRIWWSDGITALFGWPTSDGATSADTWEARVHPEDLGEILALTEEHVADAAETAWTMEYRFERADGTYAHVVDRATVQRTPDGTAVRALGGLSDITARVVAETRGRESQRLEAIGQLTGGVAHDFNNLLTVIIGAADQLEDELVDRPDVQVFAEMTRTAALRGAELVHQLLAFGRRQSLEPEPTDIDRLLLRLEDLLRRTLPESIEFALDLGAPSREAWVDPGHLEEALLELCLNARDAMPEGGRLTVSSAEVRLDGASPGDSDDLVRGDYVRVTVSDSGRGIPPELLRRVFEPFFTTKRPGTGTGLGLSTVHGFVKQSGGHVEVNSTVGEGTRFDMYLPVTSAVLTEPAPRPQPLRVGERVRILVVEDDLLVRRMATRHLVELGYEVVTAASGPEALEILDEQEPFDLLFTDVAMPGGMNGRELAVEAVARRPDLRVLFTSGYDGGAIGDAFGGSTRLLHKPYRVGDLAAAIGSSLAPRPSASSSWRATPS